MKEIPLTQGKVALVDDEDFEYLNQWKWRAVKAGKRLYAVRNIRKPVKPKKYFYMYMHRQILGLTDSKTVVDHKDMDGLNNQKCNIRACARWQNNLNTVARKDNKLGAKGIYFDPINNKYRARVKLHGKIVELGRFKNIEDAIVVRHKAAIELHKEFARQF